jgi:hypothetical protein
LASGFADADAVVAGVFLAGAAFTDGAGTVPNPSRVKRAFLGRRLTTEIAEDTEVERVRNPLSRSVSLERPTMPGAFRS